MAIWFSDNSTYKYILMLDDLDVAFAQGISGDSTSTGASMTPSKAAARISDGLTLSLYSLLNSLDGVATKEGQ